MTHHKVPLERLSRLLVMDDGWMMNDDVSTYQHHIAESTILVDVLKLFIIPIFKESYFSPTMKLCSIFSIASMVVSTQAFMIHPSNTFGAQRLSPLNMVAVDTSDIKTGMTIELDGEPHKILSFSIMKQAKAVARTTIRFKNLMRGTTVEETYISGKKLQTATIDRKSGQYTYADENGNYYFMDTETFDEVMVDAKVMEECKKWITDGMQCNLVFFKGNVIECITPNPFVYEIIETEPTMKGNTAGGGYTKPAKLSCGAMINIPGFIEQGTKVKVDTEKGEYLGRE